eukprot:gene18063-biopygen12938
MPSFPVSPWGGAFASAAPHAAHGPQGETAVPASGPRPLLFLPQSAGALRTVAATGGCLPLQWNDGGRGLHAGRERS